LVRIPHKLAENEPPPIVKIEERIVENVTAEALILEKKRQRWPNVQPTIKFTNESEKREEIKEEIEEEHVPQDPEPGDEIAEEIIDYPKHTEIIERNIHEVRQFVSHARRKLIEEKVRLQLPKTNIIAKRTRGKNATSIS
jgi:hypothetical protein